MTEQKDFRFDLFVSYTRTPDAALAREVERFVESFHQTKLPGRADPLRPLQVCVDGSDFCLSPTPGGVPRIGGREVLDIVYEYLEQSRELLVLCSENAARSAWVEKEVRWFISAFGTDRIHIAFTEGAEAWRDPARYCPRPVLEHQLHQRIAYDLRGYDARRARGWHQVPEFSREMVKLTAGLHGMASGTLYPTWLEAELERARRQSATITSSARLETYGGDPMRAVLQAFAAHELHPSGGTEAALRDAYRAAVFHHQNRRELAQFSGAGAAYLAGRWKQGSVFTETSPDGRFRLLVTERGPDGAQPPGDVYLINNETLRAIKLESREQPPRRVEAVAFDSRSTYALVTRQFDLSVYAADGRLTGEYSFSAHTTSPVHHVDGFLADRYVLGAETKGGVWLVVPGEGGPSTRTVHPEFHGDATVVTRISPDRLRATLVYESGKAALLELDASQSPVLRPIADRDVLYAGFAAGRSDLILTTAADGVLRVLEIDDRGLHEILRSDSTGAEIDWVSLDPDTNRYAVVGSDFRIHILDGVSGSLLETLDYAEDVDWRDALAVAVAPPTQIEPGLPLQPGDGVPLADLPVAALEQVAGETWIVAEVWPGEYVPEYTVRRVARETAYRVATGNAPIRAHGDLVVIGGGLLRFEGRAFHRIERELRPFPADGAPITAVLEKDGVVWLGTSNGGYRFDGRRFDRVTPANLDVSTLAEAGGRVWLGGKNGAYAIDGGRLIRTTEPFLQVEEIREAAGSVWIIGKKDLARAGPVYRVDGWMARRLPRHDANEVVLIRSVEDEDGDVWLSENHALHRVTAKEIRSIAIEPAVGGIARVGRTIWMTTQVRGVLPAPGPLFRMDAQTLAPVRLDVRGVFLAPAGNLLFVVHPDDAEMGFSLGRSVSVLSETDSRGLDLGTGWLQRIVVVEGRTWLLTSDAAFVMDGDRPIRMGIPSLSYHNALSVNGDTWLLTSAGVVRMRGDTPRFYDTQGNAVREVRTIGDEQWILTGDGLRAGPAFRLRGDRIRAETPDGDGVAAIVPYDGGLWMLTRRDGRAGPMVRVEDEKSGPTAGAGR